MPRLHQAVRNLTEQGIFLIESTQFERTTPSAPTPDDKIALKLQSILKGQIKNRTSPDACPWPPHGLYGRQRLNKTVYSFEQLSKLHSFMDHGHYRPACQAYQKIAIIVPYRDRENQLKLFFNNVLPRIYRQKQEFGVYLVEQADTNPFNRGMLMNIGFEHAIRDNHYDCFAIHDVDVLPEDDRNLYFCNNNSAYHLCGKMERDNYTLPYGGFAGAVASVSTQQYKMMNGFSNLFFGWGGEDDDFKRRLNNAGYRIQRPLEMYSHCGDVQHTKAEPQKHRYKILDRVKKMWRTDGLNNLKYNLIKKERRKLYVWIYVSIDMKILYKSGLHIRGYDRNWNNFS